MEPWVGFNPWRIDVQCWILPPPKKKPIQNRCKYEFNRLITCNTFLKLERNNDVNYNYKKLFKVKKLYFQYLGQSSLHAYRHFFNAKSI